MRLLVDFLAVVALTNVSGFALTSAAEQDVYAAGDLAVFCVRTAKDSREILDVRLIRPSSDAARDKAVVRQLLGVAIPPPVERDWVEWTPVILGPDSIVFGQPKIDCPRYKTGDPLPVVLPPGTWKGG